MAHRNETTFDFVAPNGEQFTITCYTRHATYKNYDYAYTDNESKRAYSTWVNRPWECFRYESALQEYMDKYFTKETEREFMLKQIELIAHNVSVECEEWTKAMESLIGQIKNKELVAKVIDENELGNSADDMETAIKLAVALGI